MATRSKSPSRTTLIIVESPTKARTLGQFLGSGYTVDSSYGHVRDLPKGSLGIDLEKNFAPHYVIPRKAQPNVTRLKKEVKKAGRIILATDADREGESIAWHLMQALNLNHETRNVHHEASDDGKKNVPGSTLHDPGVQRIVFHEITKSAIEEALKAPRTIDSHLVDAQQARRVLDRLVGYELSPFLWKKIQRGLSAGRVQSVALRLIADREEEIQKFKPDEYWTIAAILKTGRGDTFEAALQKIGDAALEKLSITNGSDAKKIADDLMGAAYRLESIEKKETRKHPLPPFTTSSLQQEGAKRLGFSAKKTMFLAQSLYENGFITYMRTDSVNLSKEALTEAGRWIDQNLEAPYRNAHPRVFSAKSRLAQEAHEAIRPTSVAVENVPLEVDHQKLYALIRRRFLASQLPSAVFDSLRIEVRAEGAKTYLLAATGNTLRFDGFLKFWPMKFEERELPELRENEPISLEDVKSEQHFTEPPPRYNEASLVKTLEKHGIGRPSTYAPIISVIQERNYVEKIERRFHPTEMGMIVNAFLKEHFPEIVDIQFTANMEEELDLIAEGKTAWQSVIKKFHEPFAKRLGEKYTTVEKRDMTEATDQVCEKCGKPMIIKFGRFGKFMACSGFPECKNTKTLKEPPKSSGVKCPKCLAITDRKDDPGELIERRVRKGRARGKLFWGCGKYPACDFAVWIDPVKEPPVYDPVKEAEHAAAREARKSTFSKTKKEDVIKKSARKTKKNESGSSEEKKADSETASEIM